MVMLNLSQFAVEDSDEKCAEVVRHFEQDRNGGGKIDSVQFPDEEIAVITFDRKEGWCNTVLNRNSSEVTQICSILLFTFKKNVL